MIDTAAPAATPVVLLASGGLDSTVLAYWLASKAFDVRIAFFNYGQHCVETEFRTLGEVIPKVYSEAIHYIDVSSVFENSESRLIQQADLWNDRIVADDLILPYRNMFLLSTGVAFAASLGASAVYAAFINSNHARELDATSEFLEAMNRFVSASGSVRLEMPFRELSKVEVAQLGLRIGAPIARTYSCQANGTVHCGACPNCVDRISALQAAANYGAFGDAK